MSGMLAGCTGQVPNLSSSDDASYLFWLLKNGTISGAEGEGEDNDNDDANDDDNNDSDKDDPDKGSGSGKAKDDKSDTEAALRRENRERRQEANRLRREKDAAETKLRELTDKDKSEAELAKRDLEEATQRLTKAEERNRSNSIELAFFRSNKHDWHSPAAAIRLLDSKDIEVDDDGEITGMPEALDKLAKDHPYLLKAKADKDDADDSKDEKPGGKSGASVGGKGKKDPAKTREEYARRFPAIRR